MAKPPDGTGFSARSPGRGWLKNPGTSHGDSACWEHHRTGGNLHLLCLISGVWDVDWSTSSYHFYISKPSPSTPSYQIQHVLPLIEGMIPLPNDLNLQPGDGIYNQRFFSYGFPKMVVKYIRNQWISRLSIE